jgi:hypothetical protein
MNRRGMARRTGAILDSYTDMPDFDPREQRWTMATQ